MYHYEDVHFCKMKITELIPGQKIVWHVLDNHFNFTKDQSEWIGTKIIFEITEKDQKTQIHFTHQGLVPVHECYDICRDAWTNYIHESLSSLITTGKGLPNPKGGRNAYQENLSARMNKQDYQTSITVKATAQEAFNSINNISAWWSANFEGQSENINDVFTVHFGETFITLKIVESIPYKKIRWHVTDCYKHWLKDKKEWKDTEMLWEISEDHEAAKISFTHFGLKPGMECFDGCEDAWNFYIKDSLFKLIAEGQGVPEPQ
jgi:hypothetical protein